MLSKPISLIFRQRKYLEPETWRSATDRRESLPPEEFAVCKGACAHSGRGSGAWGWKGELPGFPAPLLHCQGDRKAQVEVKTSVVQNRAAQDSTSPCATPHPASPPQAGPEWLLLPPSKARGPRPELRTQEPTPSLTSSPETGGGGHAPMPGRRAYLFRHQEVTWTKRRPKEGSSVLIQVHIFIYR